MMLINSKEIEESRGKKSVFFPLWSKKTMMMIIMMMIKFGLKLLH